MTLGRLRLPRHYWLDFDKKVEKNLKSYKSLTRILIFAPKEILAVKNRYIMQKFYYKVIPGMKTLPPTLSYIISCLLGFS